MADIANTASDIDRRVGERIRRRRVLLGVTQDQLGDALGISYQQVQKYETGANRVSAGRLYQIAQTLETSVGSFFDELSSEDEFDSETASSRYVIELVRNFSQIKDERLRSIVSSLVRALSENDEGAAAAMIMKNGGAERAQNGARDS